MILGILTAAVEVGDGVGVAVGETVRSGVEVNVGGTGVGVDLLHPTNTRRAVPTRNPKTVDRRVFILPLPRFESVASCGRKGEM